MRWHGLVRVLGLALGVAWRLPMGFGPSLARLLVAAAVLAPLAQAAPAPQAVPGRSSAAAAGADLGAAPAPTVAAAAPGDNADLRLSAAERQWVQRHPALRVGLSGDSPPYHLTDPATGRPLGFVVEMMALWSQRTGLRFSYHSYPRQEAALAALRRGEVDMVPLSSPGPWPGGGLAYTRPAYFSNLVLVARRGVPDSSATSDFGGLRVAVESEAGTTALLRERHPGARLLPFESAEAALRAVAGGQADLFVGHQHVAVFHIERLFLAPLELRRNLGPGGLPLGPVVRADQPLLHSILDKAVAATSAADRSRLAERWLPAGSVQVPLPSETARLSPQEQRWVRQNGQVRLGYDAAFAPVTLRGPLGEFQGYGADLVRLLADKAGLSIVQETGGAFADVYAQGQRGELDLVVGMARTAQRRHDYDFIGPFLSLPTVLLTRSDDPAAVADTRDIGPRKLALLRGHFLIPELRARHPGITLVELDRQDQVLTALVEGAADVGLGNLSVVNELIERRFAGRVLVTGIVKDGDSELYLGVPRQFPELTRVLSRAFEAVNDSETAQLRARWLARDVPGTLSWTGVLRVAGPLALLLGLGLGGLVLVNRRLRAAERLARQAHRQAEAATAARGRFLAYLSHELRGGLAAMGAGVELLQRSPDDAALRADMLQAIGQSSRGLLDMVASSLQHEQSLHGPVPLQPVPTALVQWWPATLAPARLAASAKGLALRDEWLGPAGTLQVDGLRLAQVVQNLLANAVKFTPQGEVLVRGQLQPGAEAGRPSLLRIEVTDSGPGLSEADRAILFQPYAQGEQGQRLRQGAGLGLAIAAQIAQAMGGTLQARPRPPGTGARFVLQVPVQVLDLAGAPAAGSDDPCPDRASAVASAGHGQALRR